MQRQLKLQIGGETLAINDTLHARCAACVCMAFIQMPTDKKGRTRRRLVFLREEKSLLAQEGNWQELSKNIRRAINRRLKKNTHALASALPFSHYLSEPDEANDTDCIRDIFTTGLLVMTLESLRAKGDTPTIDFAKATIIDRYESPFWSANMRSLGVAWGKYKPVAHLCAAWLRLLDEKQRVYKDQRSFDTLKQNLPLFLTYAAHYEHFLTAAKATGRAFYDRHKRSKNEVKPRNFMRPDQLWSVAGLADVPHNQSAGALPKIGLRPPSQVGSSDDF